MWLRYEFQSSYWWKQSMSFCLQYIQMLVFDYLFFSGYNLIVLVLHSVQSSFSVVSDSLWSHGLQHARLTCPSPVLRACSNSCPSSWWYSPTISSSVIPSLPAFNLSQHQDLFQWVGSLHQVVKVLALHLQHQSYVTIFLLLSSIRVITFLI